MIRKNEKLVCLYFPSFQSTLFLGCRAIFATFVPFSLLSETAMVIRFSYWDTASFAQQFTHCSTKRIEQTVCSRNNP